MYRLYLMTPNFQTITEIIKVSQDLGVRHQDIRVVKHDESFENKIALLSLVEPEIFKRGNVLSILARSGYIGPILGVIASFLVLKFLPEASILDSDTWTIGIFAFVGLILEVLLRYLFPGSLKITPLLERFRNALAANENMILIDIVEEKAPELLDYIRVHYPEMNV